MALNAYLRLKGEKQGLIQGSVTQKGREGKIMVIAVQHEIIANTNSTSSSAATRTAKKEHKPFVITKELDKSSPLIYNSLVQNEKMSEFILEFWTAKTSKASGLGTEIQNYTIKLTNASICDIKFVMPNNKQADLVNLSEYEEISFVYSKIEWTWVDGGITAQDDWGTGVKI